MKILETKRVVLREIVEDDAAFALDLLNQPSFIKYIGDRGVRSLAEAREFIVTRYRPSYLEHGFGLYVVELKTEFAAPSDSGTLTNVRVSALPGAPIGICGFVKRDTLPDPDIGFAFLPQHCQQGYAYEAAAAVMLYGRDVLQLKRILAITTQDNESSGRLLEKIGFEFVRLVKMPHDEDELKLFSSEA